MKKAKKITGGGNVHGTAEGWRDLPVVTVLCGNGDWENSLVSTASLDGGIDGVTCKACIRASKRGK